ncbi:hypothetical protein RMCBS344292_00883 [Rhizopus microsporus]|nr:hypothetical protein RMCBS344292_00883 [Rhizopus microsporus]
MHLGLNKLVKRKVKRPKVAGLLLEGNQATAHKMGLLYNGQYRMVELSKFYLTRDSVDDVLLVPIHSGKNYTNSSLYKVIQEPEDSVDMTPYMGCTCGSPVAVKVEK